MYRFDPTCLSTYYCWQSYTLVLPDGYNLAEVYLGFLGISQFGEEFYLDDIVIKNGNGDQVLLESFDTSLPERWTQQDVEWIGGPLEEMLEAYGDLGTVDRFDAYDFTPTLADLLPYDVVVTWNTAGINYADPVALGNVLAYYVDAGGNVINLTFSMNPQGAYWGLRGKFINDGYSALGGATDNFPGKNICLGTYDETHPIMQGVSEACESGGYIYNLTPTPGSTVVASWNNDFNPPLVAVKDNKTVASINLYPGLWYVWEGQVGDLIHNAIWWLLGPADNQPPHIQDQTVTLLGWDPERWFSVQVDDPEGDSITIEEFVQGDPDVQGVVNPIRAVCNAEHECYAEFLYTAPADHTGELSFTFTLKVNDGTSNSNTATITVNVGSVPYAEYKNVLASTSLPTTVELVGYQDVENAQLTFAISQGPELCVLGDLTPPECTTQIQGTQISSRCRSLVVDTCDGCQSGQSDIFYFTVSDGAVTSSPDYISLWLASENGAPTAIPSSALVSSGYNSYLILEATDPDVPFDGNITDALTFVIDTPPSNGSLGEPGDPLCQVKYGEPDQLVCRSAIEYRRSLFSESTSFTFHVNDSHQDSATATVDLTLQSPATWVVNATDDVEDGSCDESHCSLRDAANAALYDDVIEFDLDLPATITLAKPIVIDKDLIIAGPGADLLYISGNEVTRVFEFADNLTWGRRPITAEISGLTIMNGRAGRGAGIFNQVRSELNVVDCVIGPNNVVTEAGGGIYNRGVLYLSGSTVYGNSGTGSIGGAGIFGEASTTYLLNSTVSGNETNNDGGGIHAGYGSKFVLTHSTVSANLANKDHDLHPYGGGGGIYINGGMVELKYTIVAGNIDLSEPVYAEHDPWPDVKGDFTSLGFNLIGDPTGSTGWTEYDLTGDADESLDPLLEPLALNAPGHTPTHALISELSPAYNAIPSNDGVDRDQRDVPRPQAGAWDIGAYELKVSGDVTPLDTIITASPNVLSISADASFSFESDEAGSTFECWLDVGEFYTCTSPLAYTELGEGGHIIQVRAIDAAGNTDLTPASFSWTVDTVWPLTDITSHPINPSNNPNPEFSFESDEAGSTFECKMDGGEPESCTSPKAYSGLKDGIHVFYMRATDLAGNKNTNWKDFQWWIDTVALDTTIESHPGNPTNTADASFSFFAPGYMTTYACALDGDVWSPCTSPQSYSGLSDGSHIFKVRATDEAGNTDETPAFYSWVVDTVAPDTTITSNPANPSSSATATFEFISEAGVTFACQMDNNGFGPCTSPYTETGLSNGSHTFDIRATDAAGNTDATPASFTWTVNAASRMVVSNISLTTSKAGRLFTLTGGVTVRGSTAPVYKASVSITWFKLVNGTWTSLTTKTAPTVLTDRNGVAKFVLRGQTAGTYKLVVNSVTKTGWYYDAAGSTTFKEITVQ